MNDNIFRIVAYTILCISTLEWILVMFNVCRMSLKGVALIAIAALISAWALFVGFLK